MKTLILLIVLISQTVNANTCKSLFEPPKAEIIYLDDYRNYTMEELAEMLDKWMDENGGGLIF